MSMRRALVIAVLALLSSSCSATAAGPPAIAVDQTACSHCGMLVSEPIYAAAYHVHGREARVFDDIGCMLEALRRETAAPLDAWVQDASGNGWIDARGAIFVASTAIRSPMRGGVLAYADAAAAAAAAAAHRGEVLRSIEALMQWKREAK